MVFYSTEMHDEIFKFFLFLFCWFSKWLSSLNIFSFVWYVTKIYVVLIGMVASEFADDEGKKPESTTFFHSSLKSIFVGMNAVCIWQPNNPVNLLRLTSAKRKLIYTKIINQMRNCNSEEQTKVLQLNIRYRSRSL